MNGTNSSRLQTLFGNLKYYLYIRDMEEREWIYSSEYRRYTKNGICQLYYNGKWMTVDTNMNNKKYER